EQAKNLEVNVTVTKEGRYRNPRAVWAKVSERARTPEVRRFNQQVIESLEMMALGLPDKDLQPGETWPFESVYTIYTVTSMGVQNAQNAVFRMTCKYTGTRVRDGREEAVIELTGHVVRGSD